MDPCRSRPRDPDNATEEDITRRTTRLGEKAQRGAEPFFEPVYGLVALSNDRHAAGTGGNDDALEAGILDRSTCQNTLAGHGALVFALPIDATLLQSPYPVHRIWEVNQDDYGGDPVANLADGGVRLLIWRKGDSLRMDPLEEDAWDFLAYIGAGMPFGSVCGRLLEKRPQDVGVLLFAAIQHGWLSLSQ